MVATLNQLLEHHGPAAKAIVWEHNTHIGDARATDMARAGMVNVGQLVRQQHGRNGVVLVGFGSYSGSVIAGSAWGAPFERMHVPPAKEGSWEHLLHEAGIEQGLLQFGKEERTDPALLEARGHRAIGVVYDPGRELQGNYVPTVLPLRYDAFLHFATTRALSPLHAAGTSEAEPPETFPWGV